MLRTLTSTDGISFVPDDVPLIPGSFPSVVTLADGRFRMYLVRFEAEAGIGGEARVRSLVSDDALTWTEEEGIRFMGQEVSAVILADGRTLLAVRRVSTRAPDPLWCSGGTAVWFAVSEDGLTLEDLGEAIDGVTAPEQYWLDGRLYGVELARLSTGELVVHLEGCHAGLLAEIDEASLTLGPLHRAPFRGRGTHDAYEFLDTTGAPDPTLNAFIPDGMAGAGGDITLIVLDGGDVASIVLLDRFDQSSQRSYDAARQRIARVVRTP